jgi:hypothetical protein
VRTLFRRYRSLASGVVAVAIIAVTLAFTDKAVSVGAARQAPVKATKSRTLGFVATYFFRSSGDNSPEDCPSGITKRFDEEKYLATKFPAAEVARLMKPENTKERTPLIMNRGSNGEDVCRAPWAAADPQMPVSVGKIGVGLDLDHGQNACAHPEYTAPWGETGIDNGIARAFGCTDGYSEKGFAAHEVNYDMKTGEFTVLVEISDVDDPRNDDDVTVSVYSGADPTLASPDGDILPNATYWIHPDTLYHSSWKGKIVNGVVTTTGKHDVRLKYSYVHGGAEGEVIRLIDAGLRFEMKLDGTAEGFLGGYRDLAEVMNTSVSNSQQFYFWTCDQMYYALMKNADGYPDPKTGQCTMISAAWRIKAVPAFIVHPTAGDFETRAGKGIFEEGGGKNAGVFSRGRKGPHDITGKWTVEVLSKTQDVQYVCEIQVPQTQKETASPSPLPDRTPAGASSPAGGGNAEAIAAARAAALKKVMTPTGAPKDDPTGTTLRAACGEGNAGKTLVPVRKDGDHIAWTYDAGGQQVQVDAWLISQLTMLGTAKIGSTTENIRVWRDGKGWSIMHHQTLAPQPAMY